MLKRIYLPTFALVFVLFFIVNVKSFLDPDFGWHIQVGTHILASGPPTTDPFSYTMPTFPYVDHSWLSDVLIAKFYPQIGLTGLSLVVSLIAVAALLVSSTIFSSRIKLLPLFIGGITLGSFVAIRPLVLDWLFFSVFLYFLVHKKSRLSWLMGFGLFGLWSNLHGGFIIGLAALTIYLFFELVNKKRSILASSLLLIAPLLVTLVNPYGVGLWREVLSSVLDSNLRWTIQEWQPTFLRFEPTAIILAVTTSALMYRYHSSFPKWWQATYWLVLIGAMSSLRNVPLLVILAIPTLSRGLTIFSQEVKKIPLGREKLLKASRVFLVIIFIIVAVESSHTSFSVTHTTEEGWYPKKAVKFLANQHLNGQLFSPYEWNSYLLWKVPGQKVFIDGRMPSWTNDKAPQGESNNAFGDYQKVLSDQKFREAQFEKYDIRTVLWFTSDINRSPPTVLDSLVSAGWTEIYRDQIAVIYQKPDVLQ